MRTRSIAASVLALMFLDLPVPVQTATFETGVVSRIVDGDAAVVTRTQPVRVTGTSVILAPPAGFSPASRFPGFERADRQASIMVTEVAGPLAALTSGMNRQGLASRGMTLISSTAHTSERHRTLLLHVSQLAQGVDFLKWMLVIGDAKASVMIVGTFPKSTEAELSDAVKAAVL